MRHRIEEKVLRAEIEFFKSPLEEAIRPRITHGNQTEVQQEIIGQQSALPGPTPDEHLIIIFDALAQQFPKAA